MLIKMSTDLLSLSKHDLIERVQVSDKKIVALQAELTEVQAKLDYVLKKAFAPSSEKRPYTEQDGVQQSIFGVPVQEVAEAPLQKTTIPEHQREKSKPKGHGRQEVSRELPTEEQIIPATEADKVGPNGETLVLLGYEVSEKIDIVPGVLRRLIIKREKFGLADTRETLHTAPVHAALIPKGKATDAFVLEVILNKFHLGLPLHRQLMDLNHRGAQLSDSFLSDLIKQAAQVFRLIYKALLRQVLANRVVYADETPIRQLIPSAHATTDEPERRIRTGYFWAWIGGGQFYLHYGKTRSQDEVRTVLGIPAEGDWDPDGLIGFLVTDGYAGYNPAVTHPDPNQPPPIQRVACWAHVRRRFLECSERGDTNATQMLTLINELFRIERGTRKDIDKQHLSDEAAAALRHERRQRDSAPIIAAIKNLIDQLTPLYSPSRDLAKNLAYTNNLWNALTLFLHHHDLPLDNNTAERALRPVVVGRKNWLFVGSEDAGEWAAIFFSLIESCRMQKIDPRRYLAHVTPLLTSAQPPDPATLTPLALRETLTTR
jgi:transposase